MKKMAFPYYQPYNSYLPPTYQPPQQNNSIIWVGGSAEAQAYPVAPNNAVVLWEQSGKTIYMKSADATGKPSLRVYDIVERGAEQEDEFVKKSDLVAALSGITSEIEQMKGDLYGVAGRKKKKAEVIDDDE